MVKKGCSTYKRIRSARLSLENAEQSFLDNQDMRGELDLMLAEAELKNLRRKQGVPWLWNRQLLAMCIALLVVLAGAGGWYYAQHGRTAVLAKQSTLPPVQVEAKKSIVVLPTSGEINIQKKSQDSNQKVVVQAQLAEVDIKQLVHSARVELSSSN